MKNLVCKLKSLFARTKSASPLDEKDRIVLQNADAKIVVGRVKKVSPHPDPKITRVRVAEVQTSPNEICQILCGGQNLAPNQLVAVALPGAALSAEFQIAVREIRGQKSFGMICSRSELGLGEIPSEKDGIWVLPEQCAEFLGHSICQI